MEFSVYEWFNVVSGDVFYAGKGKDERFKSLKNSNKYFLNYINKYECMPRIVVPYMGNEDAYVYEKRLIDYCKKIDLCKTNIAEGGKGSVRLFSTSNPMYGRTWYNESTPQSKIDLWEKNVARNENLNGMYGISLKERMTATKYGEWKKNQQENKVGERSPNNKLSKIYANDLELAKLKQCIKIMQNARCVPVEFYDEYKVYIEKFDYLSECADFLINLGLTGTKKENLVIKILECKKSGNHTRATISNNTKIISCQASRS